MGGREARGKGLGLATIILMGGFVGSRLLGLVRDVAIGHTFGTSPELDAYFAAFRLPDLIFQLLAGAALGSAFIPVFASLMAKENRLDAWQVASSVLNGLLLLTSFFALAAILLAPWLMPLIAPGFPPQTQALATQLARIMLIAPIFFGASGIAMGILQAGQHFLLPALAPMLYNLSIIGGALLLGDRYGVYGLAFGVVMGSILHLGVQLPGLARQGMVYRAIASITHPGVKEVMRLMFPRMLGLGAVQMNFLVTTILASLLPSGSLAALNYAWPLAMLPLGLFGISISTAAFPGMAEEAALGRFEALRATTASRLRLILFLTIPASAGLVLLREPIVALLYQRGGFDVESTQAVAWALLFYSLGLFAHAMLEILSRAFYALHDTATPVVVGVGAMVLNILFSLVLIRFLGHGGLALSLSLATILEAMILLGLLQRRLAGLEGRRLAFSSLRSCLATAVMVSLLWLFLQAGFLETSLALRWMALASAIALGAASYLLASIVLGSEEGGLMLSRIVRA